jgi:hypothetical protein
MASYLPPCPPAGGGQERCFNPRLIFSHDGTEKLLREALGTRWCVFSSTLGEPCTRHASDSL